MIIQICVKLMLIWIFWLDANIESKRIELSILIHPHNLMLHEKSCRSLYLSTVKLLQSTAKLFRTTCIFHTTLYSIKTFYNIFGRHTSHKRSYAF